MSGFIVRPVKITDLPALRQARQRRVLLSFPDAAADQVVLDLLSAVPIGRRYARQFAAVIDGSIQAVAELRPEPADYRWAVSTLLIRGVDPETDPDTAAALWAELLRHAIKTAGASGAKRLHAIAPTSGAAFDALYQTGFSVYGYQTVMLAQGLHRAEVLSGHLRSQQPSDLWSIHHLYSISTPRTVQYAQAFNSEHWEIRRGALGRAHGFVLEEKQDVVGYCRVVRRGRQAAFKVLVHEGSSSLVGPLVARSAELAGVDKGMASWIAVPDYHQDYRHSLEAIGFRSFERRVMMVRYTTVPVCASLDRRVARLSEVTDRLPARAPSYSVARSDLTKV